MRTLIALSLLAAPAVLHAQEPAGNAQQPVDELASYRRALDVTQAGMDALGGADAWSRLEGLVIRFEGDLVHRHQSRRVEPPYERTPVDGWVAYDNAGQRFGFEQGFSYPGGFDTRFRVLTDGRSAYWLDLMRRTAEPLAGAGTGQFQPFLERMPQAIVARALARRGTLRYAGRRSIGGGTHDVVTFAGETGTVFTLAFDADSHLLSRVETLGPDVTEGDAVSTVEFADYRPLGGTSGSAGLMIPGSRLVTVAGEPLAAVRYAASAGPVPDSLFGLPGGFALDTIVFSPRVITPRTLSPGVHAIQGAAGNTVLAVEFADHLMVIEPSGGDATSRAVLDTLARLVPGKPVRYVVATHFHDDHAGGVRGYMNAGATVITTPAYVSFFQRVARRAGTLGAPEQPLTAARIETVQGGRRVFEDATRRVELLDIGRNPHTDEMLVAWLPNERIIFQGDLWNPPWGDVGVRRQGNATTRYFAEWLRRSRLQPETVVGVHGPIQSRAELDAAISP